MILFNKYIVPKDFVSLTLFPFIFLKSIAQKENKVLLNHEKIHLQQQKEMLVLFFYLWYTVEFLVRFVKTKNKNKAYRGISFEQEAYAHETDMLYIEKRPKWAFLKYL
jgi:hypothetical protein